MLALAPSLATGHRGSLVGVRSPPSPYIKAPLEESLTQVDWGAPWKISPLLAPSCATPLLSLSCGSPKGCVGVRETPPLHDEVLREFRIGSKLIYFHNLGWIRDPEGVIVHRMCTSTTRCCMCGTQLLYRCCHTGVVSSRSSWPWGWPRRLHRQHLCGSIIPVFGLQGYLTKSLLIVTALLLDRSWAIRGCVGILLFVPNPNSGIRAWSVRSMLVQLKRLAICGRWSSHCYPPMCICLYLWHSWIEAARRPTLCVSHETGSTTDIRLAPYKSGLWGVCFSNYYGYGVYNGGPLTGNQRNNFLINIVVACS
jgi:hypothetical protein